MIKTVLASYFVSEPDPLPYPASSYRNHVSRSNLDNRFWDSNYNLLMPLIHSVISNNSEIIIFHDCFEETPLIPGCRWIKVLYNKIYVPTIYRWFVYYDYLIKNHKYKNVFMVDSTDVVMLKNTDIINDVLYCGTQYAEKFYSIYHLNLKRKHITIPDFDIIFEQHKNHILLNCGIVGGSYNICLDFLKHMTYYHSITSQNIKISLDMPIFNYVLLKHFQDKINIGSHINTKFNKYEYNSISVWKHK